MIYRGKRGKKKKYGARRAPQTAFSQSTSPRFRNSNALRPHHFDLLISKLGIRSPTPPRTAGAPPRAPGGPGGVPGRRPRSRERRKSRGREGGPENTGGPHVFEFQSAGNHAIPRGLHAHRVRRGLRDPDGRARARVPSLLRQRKVASLWILG